MKVGSKVLCFGLMLACMTASAMADESFDAKVHAYLVAHPEVLIEMSAVLQQRQQAAAAGRAGAAIKANHAALFADKTDPVTGNRDGDLTIVEFFDFQCPFCKAEAPSLARLVAEDGHIRMVYKQYPVIGGPGSMTAAKAALAAVKQHKYRAFHEALMKDKTREGELSEKKILDAAKSAGLDVEKLRHDMAAPEVAAKVGADLALGRAIGISGTPALIIGDHLVAGAVPYPELTQLIAQARAGEPAPAPAHR